MSKASLGHFGEIFQTILSTPQIEIDDMEIFERILGPICLDSYVSFDRKRLGDWRIIAHQIDYELPSDDRQLFAYGANGNRKLVDIYGQIYEVTDQEAEGRIPYTSYSDLRIQKILDDIEACRDT